MSLRVLHIIPGLDAGATQTLNDEHVRALESISAAVAKISQSDVDLRAVLVHDPSWPVPAFRGIEHHAEPIDFVTVPKLKGIRPKFRSFFPEALVSEADYVIFTNSDICVTPNFYEVVVELINEGIAAGSIHRKTVLGLDPSRPESVAEAIASPNWYLHPGSDCFFFPSTTARALRHGELVMGAPPVGRHAIGVMSTLNSSFQKFPKLGVTFHFGDDRIWRIQGPLRRLTKANYRAWHASLPSLLRQVGWKAFVRGMGTARIQSRRDWLQLSWNVLKASLSGFGRFGGKGR